MRRRILVVALTAVVVAITLFGVPLAVAVDRALYSDERGELERIALRGAVSVSPDFRRDPIELPPAEPSVSLAVYDVHGTRVIGRGPLHVEAALLGAAQHDVVETQTAGDILVAVPVSSGENVVALVRASDPRSDVRHRIWWAWAAMAGLALAALACAAGVAAAQSRRLSRPLSRLAEASERLGDGDLGVRAGPSGVAEIDQVGDALNRTTARLASLVERERSLATHASHQLRTPLTALRLELESALGEGPDRLSAAVEEAIVSADQLSVTIDDVLAATRPDSADDVGFAARDLLDDVRRRWHGILAATGRQLRIASDDDDLAGAAPRGVARQIVDVLVDNAYRHGGGAVTVRARDAGGALAIDVIDEGHAPDLKIPADPAAGVVGAVSAGLGLPLARRLAEAHGGRLVVGFGEVSTRVSVLLPHRDGATRR